MSWIELHQSLVEHKKMDALIRETGLRRDAAVGRLCILWLWALGNREDGRLSGVDARRLGQILDLQPRRAAVFLEALEHSGFLDRDGEELRIHDWGDYAGKLIEIRRKNAETKKRYRDRCREREAKSQEDVDADRDMDRDADRDADRDMDRDMDVPFLPDQTQPDQTKPDQTKPDLKSLGIEIFDPADHPELGAGPGNEKLTDYLLDRGLLPEKWLGATPELLDRSRVLTDGLFKVFCTRKPGRTDYAKVFPLVTLYRRESRDRIWDEDGEDLLGYAFEQAALSGAGGNWTYIDGVLSRLYRRGIRTRRDAEDFEERWRNGEIPKVT